MYKRTVATHTFPAKPVGPCEVLRMRVVAGVFFGLDFVP
jgi:hypothetical protein